MGGIFSSTSSDVDSGTSSPYGDITEVETSGAAYKTAQQDKLGYHGIKASHRMAEMDKERMKSYKSMICEVADDFKIDPALIAAIISRESRAGNALKDGWGDWNPKWKKYNAWGLMQVDRNPEGGGHTLKGKWNSEEHLRQGTGILVDFIKKMQKHYPRFSKEEQLKGGIAAYNIGDGKVNLHKDVDANTTGGDYSNDVVARAQWYKKKYVLGLKKSTSKVYKLSERHFVPNDSSCC